MFLLILAQIMTIATLVYDNIVLSPVHLVSLAVVTREPCYSDGRLPLQIRDR